MTTNADLFVIPPGHHQTRDGRVVKTVRRNAFRNPITGKLDREYLRTCAIYRLLKHRKITKAQALAIAPRLRATIEIWLNGPLR
jgi:hypothetical protein